MIHRTHSLARRVTGPAIALAALGLTLAAGAAQAFEPGDYCLQRWPNDKDNYHLCQALQDRNQSRFIAFLSRHGLSEDRLAQRAREGDRAAGIAHRCMERWAPDYQRIWRCTREHARHSGS